jgi:hypothetical protein
VKKVGKRSVDVNSAKLDLLEKKAKYEAEKLKTSEAPEATVNLDALQRAVTKCSNKLASEEQKLADAETSVNDFVSHFGFYIFMHGVLKALNNYLCRLLLLICFMCHVCVCVCLNLNQLTAAETELHRLKSIEQKIVSEAVKKFPKFAEFTTTLSKLQRVEKSAQTKVVNMT